MGFGEAVVKVIFWSRIRMMRRIGDAARLIGEGRAEQTLEILGRMERRIPPYVGYLFFLTKGRALDELGRRAEAEQAYQAAVFSKQGATEAHLHLAVLCGRERRFDEARAWISRARDDNEAAPGILEQATELESLLDEIAGGARLDGMVARAAAFARRHGLDGLEPAEALAAADRWIEDHHGPADDERDDLACWLGELAARSRPGASWRVSLALEECDVVAGDWLVRPFDLVASRLEGGASLVAALEL